MSAIYKPSQGYYTRVISVAGIGLLAATGSAWLWRELAITNNTYIQGVGAAVLMVLAAALCYFVYGYNRRSVDFFIAVEGEMKKVNWSTRREIIGSTWVVIIVALAIAMILFVVDILFAEIFKLVGVLYGDSAVVGFFRDLFN